MSSDPQLPWIALRVNQLLNIFAQPKIIPEKIVARATGNTGITTESDKMVRKGLQGLADAYNKTSKLHALGALATKINLAILYGAQLQIAHERKVNPQVAKEIIAQPIVITGLPRTGTSLLQELLHQDPALRTPLAWEAMYPLPIEDFYNHKLARRCINKTRRRFAFFDWLAPGFAAVHRLSAERPQECLCLFAPFMVSDQFMAASYLPNYQVWLDQQPTEKIYHYHRMFLQHLQASQNKSGQPPRWLLKAPGHLSSLAGLHKQYPDLKVVMTHRDPSAVVASIASLHLHLYAAFSDFRDKAAIGKWVSDWWSQAWHSANDYRQNHQSFNNAVLDVQYEDLVRQPMVVVRRIYSHCGMSLSEAVLTKMANYLKNHHQGQYGQHNYTLAEFGLQADVVKHSFDWRRT